MQRLGFRTWREIRGAVRWTFTTAAGWRHLAAYALALAIGGWVGRRHGETPGFITLLVALTVVHVVAPPAPDGLGGPEAPGATDALRGPVGRRD